MNVSALTGAVTAASEEVISGIKTVVEAGTDTFSISTIASILGVTLASAATLFLLWWGARKGIKMLKNAFTKGKLSI